MSRRVRKVRRTTRSITVTRSLWIGRKQRISSLRSMSSSISLLTTLQCRSRNLPTSRHRGLTLWGRHAVSSPKSVHPQET